MKIQQDHSRFRAIVRGQVARNLRRYMASGDLVAQHGAKTVRIPVPRIELPRFRLGRSEGGDGVGQGDGDVGDVIDTADGEAGPGDAGSDEGTKDLDLEVTLEELAEIMAQELELPRIEPRGAEKISTSAVRYSGVRAVGPESLRTFKRTYQEALKRMIASGEYDPSNPVVIPRPEDRRYRSWTVDSEPVTQAVIIYMMDVSGSMGDEQKEIVRLESFWIDTWLRSQYEGIESRYIIHDATAREVERETFFRTRESGGTMISSAYVKCLELLDEHYPSGEWNIYPFHFSDGDNWSLDDTAYCMRLLETELVPRSNLFCYGQVVSPYGSGQFLRDLQERFAKHEKVATSEIRSREMIYDGIKDLLGRGF